MANKTEGDQLSDEDMRRATGINADDEARIDAQTQGGTGNKYRNAWGNSRAAVNPKRAAQHARYGDTFRPPMVPRGGQPSNGASPNMTGINADKEALHDAQAHHNPYQEDWARRQLADDSAKTRGQRARYGDNLRLRESDAASPKDEAPIDATDGELPSDSNARLAAQEQKAADDTNYTGDGNKEGGKDKKRKGRTIPLTQIPLSKVLNKKKAGIFGAITGSIISIITFCLTFLSGPLEFIHFAQIEHDAHFSTQEFIADGRMGKLYRFLRKGRVGETRLGFVASKYHEKIVGDMSNIGITNDPGPLDYEVNFTIDTEHENSPYKGMAPEEAAAAFEAKTGYKADIVDGKVKVLGKSFWSEPKALKAVVSLTGHSKVTSAVRARILAKYLLVSRWHPLEALIKKQIGKLADYLTEKWKNVYGGETTDPVGIDGSTATDGKDKNGNPIPASPGEQEAATKAISDPKTSSGILKNFMGGKALATTDAVANFAGVACALKAVNDNVAKIRYLTVIVPLTRMGMETIIIGDQIKSGQDVDQRELQYLAKNFAQAAAAGAALTWYDNAQVRASAHEKGGIDSLAKNGMKDLITQNSLKWLQWTQSLGSLCSPAGQAVSGIVSIGIGVLTDGVASTVVGLALSQLQGPLLDEASKLLAGQAVDTAVGANAGPTWGGEIDEGATFGANANAIAMGGTAMTPAQNTALTAMVNKDQRDDFHAQSLYAQMFDPSDYRSLVSRLADSTGGSPLVAMNKLFSNTFNATSNILALPFNMFSSMAHADDPTTYDYGFPMYGFDLQSQSNPLVENPYANADEAALILDNNNQGDMPDYIQKAEDCFGVKITKGQEGWDVIPEKDVNVYDTRNYNPADCAGPQVGSNGKVITASKIVAGTADPTTGIKAQTATTALSDSQAADWLRIRFFILDTGVMEGYACAQFSDPTSCANDGMGGPNGAASGTTDALPAQLAAQLLGNPSVTLSNSAKADLQAAAVSQHVTPGPVSATDPCKSSGPVTIDANLLQSLVNISQEYSFTIDNLVSGHACDSGRHPLGRAADITELDGKPINWTGANLAPDKEFANNVAMIMYGLMPNGSIQNGQPVNMPGIGVCHQDDISPPPEGVNYYVYPPCDRLVIDVGTAGAP